MDYEIKCIDNAGPPSRACFFSCPNLNHWIIASPCNHISHDGFNRKICRWQRLQIFRHLLLPRLLVSSTYPFNPADPTEVLVLPHSSLLPTCPHLASNHRRCFEYALIPQYCTAETDDIGRSESDLRLDDGGRRCSACRMGRKRGGEGDCLDILAETRGVGWGPEQLGKPPHFTERIVRRIQRLNTSQVEETAQKNIVLTLYELTEGETTLSQGMLDDTLALS